MKKRSLVAGLVFALFSSCQGTIELHDDGLMPDGYQQADFGEVDASVPADGGVLHDDNFFEDLPADAGSNPCAGVTCSGHGTCVVQSDGPVCICDQDFSPGDASGLTCVPTSQVCVGGPINLDVDEDGVVDTWFEPNEWECWMYELVNRTRASHDDQGSPECHKPLLWSVEWSAHGRNHSLKMKLRGSLFHEDYPWGQNCAYGCDPPCEMNMYMTGPGEGHCPPLSHHCNIMRCGFSHIGIGYVDTWNTQNFY